MTASQEQARTREQTHGPDLDDAFDLELEQMALAVADEPPPLEEPREPGLWRYAKFQLRDYAKHKAVFLLGLGLLALWIFRYNYDDILRGFIRNGRVADQPSGVGDPETFIFRSIVLVASLAGGALASLFSASGIVSRDREGGYQKFLFAKPVRITRFYLQAFLVNGVGLLLTSGLLLAITSAVFLRPVPVVVPLVGIAGAYVAIGGLTFLLSTLVRFELAVTAMLVLLSVPLRQLAEQGRWWAIVLSSLGPDFKLIEAFDPDGSGKVSVFQAVGTCMAYGAAYIAAGVAVLKKRSIMR